MKNQVVTVALAAILALPAGAAFGQQPPAQPQPAQSAGTQTGLTIASDSLLGTKVRDAEGKDIGDISKLMIDAREGKITSAIIRHGGTLGMGGKEISVPWEALRLQRGQNQQLVVTMQQQFLDQAPPSEAERHKAERDKQQAPSASPSTGQQDRKQQ
jgi:sporulation protein YlmC with PRC-barrel domain